MTSSSFYSPLLRNGCRERRHVSGRLNKAAEKAAGTGVEDDSDDVSLLAGFMAARGYICEQSNPGAIVSTRGALTSSKRPRLGSACPARSLDYSSTMSDSGRRITARGQANDERIQIHREVARDGTVAYRYSIDSEPPQSSLSKATKRVHLFDRSALQT